MQLAIGSLPYQDFSLKLRWLFVNCRHFQVFQTSGHSAISSFLDVTPVGKEVTYFMPALLTPVPNPMSVLNYIQNKSNSSQREKDQLTSVSVNLT